MRIQSLLVATSILALDQILKYVAKAQGSSQGIYTYTLNTGVTFGFFPDANTSMIVISILAVGLIMYAMRTSQNYEFFGLSLVLAGVVSNLSDRILVGGVIDYIRIGNFPIFNIADALIICGVAFLIGLEVQNSSRSSRSSK